MGCHFILLLISFAVQKPISLIRSYLFIFVSIALGDWPKKTLVWFMSEDAFPMFSFKSLKSLSHFEFIFVNNVKLGSDLTDLHVVVQLPSSTCWRDCSPLYLLQPRLLRSNWLCVWGLISGVCVPLHWPIFLFLCPYCAFLIAGAL